MTGLNLLAVALLATCSIATAQDVLLTGHVQRVILQPSGTENCPPSCPRLVADLPTGVQHVCVSNGGGCQTMEVRIDHLYRGEASGETRQFKSRIGEWGPSFPVTAQLIVASEGGGNVFWSPATEREGKIFIDPKRLRQVAGLPIQTAADGDLLALDEVLARVEANRR